MSTMTKSLSDCNHFELLEMLVPNIKEHIDQARAENPELIQEIGLRHYPITDFGFQPFRCLCGGGD